MPDIKRRSIWVFRIPGASVELTTYGDIWESSLDFDVLTARRCQSLGGRVEHGAWFFCPQYTVYSPMPSADFFRVVREARGQWLMQARKVMGQGDFQREKRKAERQGRKVAFLDLDRPANGVDGQTRPPEVIPLDQLSGHDREQVLLGGMLAKGWAMTGVLIIDGRPVSPHDGNRMADALLNPAALSSITATQRRCDLASLRATGDPSPLSAVARAEIQTRLDLSPAAALYVTPQLTIAAPGPNPEFFRRARDGEARWYGLTNRLLGNARRKVLARAADPATRTLVFAGTLVVNGEFFIGGLWPDRPVSPSRLKRTPYLSPTVPAEFLGLTPFPRTAEK